MLVVGLGPARPGGMLGYRRRVCRTSGGELVAVPEGTVFPGKQPVSTNIHTRARRSGMPGRQSRCVQEEYRDCRTPLVTSVDGP